MASADVSDDDLIFEIRDQNSNTFYVSIGGDPDYMDGRLITLTNHGEVVSRFISEEIDTLIKILNLAKELAA